MPYVVRNFRIIYEAYADIRYHASAPLYQWECFSCDKHFGLRTMSYLTPHHICYRFWFWWRLIWIFRHISLYSLSRVKFFGIAKKDDCTKSFTLNIESSASWIFVLKTLIAFSNNDLRLDRLPTVTSIGWIWCSSLEETKMAWKYWFNIFRIPVGSKMKFYLASNIPVAKTLVF